MLRFYGLQLADEKTGQVDRLADEPLYTERMDNLNRSAHNWLRVSRIITSLGELGFVRYKRPLLERLEAEVQCGALANARRSLADFWRPLLDGEAEPWYAAKTKEVAEDREEGVLFQPGGELAS